MAGHRRYDVVCSIFGALSVESPTLLIDVARQLQRRGLIAVAARLDQHSRSATSWASLATLTGFTIQRWDVVDHPTDRTAAPCLIFTAARQ
jgi:hypothetical protein